MQILPNSKCFKLILLSYNILQEEIFRGSSSIHHLQSQMQNLLQISLQQSKLVLLDKSLKIQKNFSFFTEDQKMALVRMLFITDATISPTLLLLLELSLEKLLEASPNIHGTLQLLESMCLMFKKTVFWFRQISKKKLFHQVKAISFIATAAMVQPLAMDTTYISLINATKTEIRMRSFPLPTTERDNINT